MKTIAQEQITLAAFLAHMKRAGIEKNNTREIKTLQEIIWRHFGDGLVKILDVGSGTGRTADFYDEAHDVTFIEPRREYHEYSIEHHPGKHFVRSDLLSYPMDEKFDIVVMLYTFIQMFDLRHQETLLLNAFDRLKAGGICIVDVMPRTPKDAVDSGDCYKKVYTDGGIEVPYFFPKQSTFYRDVGARRKLQLKEVRYSFCKAPIKWTPLSIPFPHKFLIFKP